jgi:hypothetical protein
MDVRSAARTVPKAIRLRRPSPAELMTRPSLNVESDKAHQHFWIVPVNEADRARATELLPADLDEELGDQTPAMGL